MTRLTDKQLYSCFPKATASPDPDAFAADAVLSLLDSAGPAQEADPDLLCQLRTLWQVANAPFRDLLDLMGLNQTQCATRFCIPLRTVQDWAGGRRAAPLYLRLMMAEAMQLLDLRDPRSEIRAKATRPSAPHPMRREGKKRTGGWMTWK